MVYYVWIALVFSFSCVFGTIVDVHILNYGHLQERSNFSESLWCPLHPKDSNCHYHQRPQDNHNIPKERGQNVIFVSMLSIYHKISKEHICQHNPNLTFIETVEATSNIRFNEFTKHFDGNGTTHPDSTISRIYKYYPLKEKDFIVSLRNFSELIKGASFVASSCSGLKGHVQRNHIIKNIRDQGFRVDGLGKCMQTPVGPEGVELDKNRTMANKMDIISRYLFNMAFENTIEKGYVTEKAAQALMAGTVPVYLGDEETLRSLIPDPNGAIYLSDFGYNVSKLVTHLNYLANNETAYEMHRAWRRSYSEEGEVKRNRKFQSSFHCDVCEWARKAVSGPRKGCLKNYTDSHFHTIFHLRKPFKASLVVHENFLNKNSTW